MAEERRIQPLANTKEMRERLEQECGVILSGSDPYLETMCALTLDLFQRVAELEDKLERAGIK